MEKEVADKIIELEREIRKLNEKEKYQGWANRETWAYDLWLSNDEGFYDSLMEIIDKAIKDNPDDRDQAISDIEDYLKANFEELKEFAAEIAHKDCKNSCVHSMLDDIGSDWRIDYREIAAAEIYDKWEEYEKAKKEEKEE